MLWNAWEAARNAVTSAPTVLTYSLQWIVVNSKDSRSNYPMTSAAPRTHANWHFDEGNKKTLQVLLDQGPQFTCYRCNCFRRALHSSKSPPTIPKAIHRSAKALRLQPHSRSARVCVRGNCPLLSSHRASAIFLAFRISPICLEVLLRIFLKLSTFFFLCLTQSTTFSSSLTTNSWRRPTVGTAWAWQIVSCVKLWARSWIQTLSLAIAPLP